MELHNVCNSAVHLVGEKCSGFSRCIGVCRNVVGQNKVLGFYLVLRPCLLKGFAVSDMPRDWDAIVHCFS